MENSNPEQNSFLWKVGIYAIGLVLGITAKLATLADQKQLSWGKAWIHGTIALSSGWCCWWLLESKGMTEIAPVAGAVIGRYGDHMLLAIWKGFKKAIFPNMDDK